MANRTSKPGGDAVAAHRLLLARIARRYYLDNLSKVEIAGEFGVSRFQVARLIEEAIAQGVVTIEIEDPRRPPTEQEAALARSLGIEGVRIVPDAVGEPLLERVGAAVVTLLNEYAVPGMTIGFASSRALDAAAGHLADLPPSTVVQLTGASEAGAPGGLTRMLMQLGHGSGLQTFPIYAPLVVDEVTTAQDLLRQPVVAQTLEKADALDIAVVSVGAWREGESSVWQRVSPEVREACTDAGAVAEFSGLFMDEQGHPVATPLDGRTIGVSLRQLADAKFVIGAVYGSARAEAARAVSRSGLFSWLVIDSALAEAL